MHIDFGLSGIGLTLGILNSDAGTIQPVTDLPHQALFFCCLKNMIIFIIGADRRHRMIVGVANGFEAFPKHEKFQLGRCHHAQTDVGCPFELLFKNSTRRMRH